MCQNAHRVVRSCEMNTWINKNTNKWFKGEKIMNVNVFLNSYSLHRQNIFLLQMYLRPIVFQWTFKWSYKWVSLHEASRYVSFTHGSLKGARSIPSKDRNTGSFVIFIFQKLARGLSHSLVGVGDRDTLKHISTTAGYVLWECRLKQPFWMKVRQSLELEIPFQT